LRVEFAAARTRHPGHRPARYKGPQSVPVALRFAPRSGTPPGHLRGRGV